MFPDKKVQYYRIISALELEWEPKREYAVARNFNALSFRIKGNAVFEGRNECTSVGGGEVAFVPQGYDYTLDEKTHAHLFVVHFEALPERAVGIEALRVANPLWYEEHFRKLHRIWQRKEAGYRLAAASVFYRILEELEKEALEEKPCVADRLSSVVEYIHANYTDPTLSVSRLSEMYGASQTYFRRIFKETYSALPLQYINNLRLKRAEELLRSGYYTVSQAASESGFSDVKYFSRFVKKIKGDAPSKLWKE